MLSRNSQYKKILASCLVCILVVVPFIIDSGVFFIEASASSGVIVSDDYVIIEEDEATPTDGSATKNNPYTYIYGADSDDLRVKLDCDNNHVLYRYALLDNVMEKFKEGQGPDSSIAYHIENFDENYKDTYGQFYAWYNITEIPDTQATPSNPNATINEYTLSKLIKISRIDPNLQIKSDLTGFYNSTMECEVDYETTYSTGNTLSNKEVIGDIKCYIINGDHDILNIKDEDLEGATLCNMADDYKYKATNLIDGKHIFVVGYFIDDKIYDFEAQYFTVDATAPAEQSVKVVKKDDDNTYTEVPINELLNLKNKYAYAVEVSEEQQINCISGIDEDSGDISEGIKLKSVTFKGGEQINNASNETVYKDGIFYIDIENGTPETGYVAGGDFTFGDNIGNLYEIELPGVKFFDNKVDFTVKQVSPSTNNYINSNGELIDNAITNEEMTIQVNMSTKVDIKSYSVDAVIKDEDTQITGDTVSSDTVNKKSIDITVVIPKKTNINQYLDSLVVKCVTDYSTESKKIGSILYDQTKPVITDNYTLNGWTSSKTVTYNLIDKKFVGEESGIASGKVIISNSVKDEILDLSEVIGSSRDKEKIIYKLKIPESKTIEGTKVEIKVKDASGNYETFCNTYYIDNTNPTSDIQVINAEGQTVNATPVSGDLTVKYSYTDNLTIKNGEFIVDYPSGKREIINISSNNIAGKIIKKEYVLKGVEDGIYTASLVLQDKSGKTTIAKKAVFEVDNTSPTIDVRVLTGKSDKKNKFFSLYEDNTKYGLYYKGDVEVQITVDEKNFDTSKVFVKDNGNEVTGLTWSSNKTQNKAVIRVSDDGKHVISVDSIDYAGNDERASEIKFVIDNKKPVVTTILNGLNYSRESIMEYYQKDAQLDVSVSDDNKDLDDLVMGIIKTYPNGNKKIITSNIKEGRSEYPEEADYQINIVSKDKSNNISENSQIKFRIDKTAPRLDISGIADGGASQSSVNLTYTLTESFHWDMQDVKIDVYKKLDGESESLIKTVDVEPSAEVTTITEAYTDDGIYRVEFSATDKVGNTTNESHTFTLDHTAPVITLTGVNNYDVTDQSVSLEISIVEDFFSTNQVELKGTRLDIDGIANDINFGVVAVNSSKVSQIVKQFEEDGIYDIVIVTTDKNGNSSNQKVHFTIDKTSPAIADLNKFNGTILKEFSMGTSLDDMVKDLTVCDVKMLLNGLEYDGVSEIKDGKQILKVIAIDEMSQSSEVEVEFLIDQTAPVILISGVEDDGKYYENLNISVNVQLDEDMLSEVLLNGEKVDNINNTASITISEKDNYELVAIAYDKAGNEVITIINFEYANKTNWMILIGAGVGGLVVVCSGGYFLLKLLIRK